MPFKNNLEKRLMQQRIKTLEEKVEHKIVKNKADLFHWKINAILILLVILTFFIIAHDAEREYHYKK